jgi:Icc-related predicted phosphoesterase
MFIMLKYSTLLETPFIKFILDRCEEQPLLTLRGHFHESPQISGLWMERVGKTICIQPGQPSDKLVYVSIDLRTLEIDRYIEKPLSVICF